MNAREQRGLAIANQCKIVKSGQRYLVPSQSNPGCYSVFPSKTEPRCTCPDHAENGHKCKHIFAVEIVMERQANPDGSNTLTETVKVTETIRKTYAQQWPQYNAAQTNEKAKFQLLLNDLSSRVPELPRAKTGRKPLPMSDVIFSVIFKVYSTFSGRRFMTDLTEAHAKGYLSKLPHYNSIFNYLEMPELTPILKQLIAVSARPLAAIESSFAVDSSGFSTSKFARWFDAKYGVERKKHVWVKCHLCCGVTTNVVTSAEISDAGDAPMLPPLVKDTAQTFAVKEVSADKAYLSADNLETVDGLGATPFIVFKRNSVANKSGALWEKMYHYFSFRHDDFMSHYHKRSNAESTFSMIKRKHGDHVRSKTDVAMMNEVLCKILCHNICCVIQSMYELNVEPTFWADAAPATLPMPAAVTSA